MDKNLYYLAIIPPEPHFSLIQKLKEEISNHYNTFKALKSPPHITLIPPFQYPEKEEITLRKIIDEFNREIIPFEIELDGYSWFDHGVLFIKVLHHVHLFQIRERLKVLLQSLINENIHIHEPFKPHVTLALKDWSKAIFETAKTKFTNQNIRCRFTVHQIHILKHVQGKWIILDTIL